MRKVENKLLHFDVSDLENEIRGLLNHAEISSLDANIILSKTIVSIVKFIMRCEKGEDFYEFVDNLDTLPKKYYMLSIMMAEIVEKKCREEHEKGVDD